MSGTIAAGVGAVDLTGGNYVTVLVVATGAPVVMAPEVAMVQLPVWAVAAMVSGVACWVMGSVPEIGWWLRRSVR